MSPRTADVDVERVPARLGGEGRGRVGGDMVAKGRSFAAKLTILVCEAMRGRRCLSSLARCVVSMDQRPHNTEVRRTVFEDIFNKLCRFDFGRKQISLHLQDALCSCRSRRLWRGLASVRQWCSLITSGAAFCLQLSRLTKRIGCSNFR